ETAYIGAAPQRWCGSSDGILQVSSALSLFLLISCDPNADPEPPCSAHPRRSCHGCTSRRATAESRPGTGALVLAPPTRQATPIQKEVHDELPGQDLPRRARRTACLRRCAR